MRTPQNKYFLEIPKSISEIKIAKETIYPIPSKFFLDIQYSVNHLCRFGYQSKDEANEDQKFFIELLKK